MYDDLVKALRVCVDKDKDCFDCPYYSKCMGNDSEKHKAMADAADAIEELSAYVRQIEELRKDGYYLQKTKMMTDGQAIMTMPLPEPPKEEN